MSDVRDHLSTGLNRARVAIEVRRSLRPIASIAVGVVIALGCWLIVFRNVGKYVYTSSRQVAFAVSDADGVIGGGRQQLRFKGIPAGVISSVKLVHGQAVITALLYNQYGAVYRNASAALRPASALDDMYLDILDRGTPAAGAATPAAPVPAARTQVGVQVSDVLDTFQPDVRTHLATVLDELGQGLKDHGQSLRMAFVQLAPFLRVAANITSQLDQRATLTRSLVHDTSVLTDDLAQRQTQLRQLVSSAGTTLGALNAVSPSLAATLSQLPPTLGEVDSSFAAVRGVLPVLDRAVVSLEPVAREVPSGLAAIRTLSATATPAVQALRPPVAALVPLAHTLTPVSSDLQTATERLLPQVPAVDHITRAVAQCPTALQGFFQWTPSLFKFGDANLTPIRGDLAVGLDSSGVVSDPNSTPSPGCAGGSTAGGTPGP